MSQSDLYLVPTAAFIEHFVINEALKTNCSLKEASQRVCSQFGVRNDLEFPLRQTRLLGLLYCLLVFPSEMWKRDDLLNVVIERAQADTALLLKNRENITSNVIRSIRNAVAHARVHFNNDTVTFEDRRGDGQAHFQLTLSYSDTMNLILVLGRAFHESAQVKAFFASARRRP